MVLIFQLASVIQSRLSKEGGIYASNWLERLRKIKSIKAKVDAELQASTLESSEPEKQELSIERRNNTYDFTEYTA